MNQLVANFFVLALIVVLVLLAIQAEPVTAVMGYVLAGILALALLAQTLKGK
jgi:hypothetical protein